MIGPAATPLADRINRSERMRAAWQRGDPDPITFALVCSVTVGALMIAAAQVAGPGR